MSVIRKWEEGIDPEDALWVCQVCDAELHTDCVGETCPACGAPVVDDEGRHD
jgi:rubrerythrin